MRSGHITLLEGNRLKMVAYDIQEFIPAQQESRIGRMAVLFMTHHECLVNQYAALVEGGHQQRKQRPPKIIGHDYSGKIAPAVRPGACLEIRATRRDTGNIAQRLDYLGIAIHRLDGKSEAGKITCMAPAAARQIEDVAAGIDQRRKALHPRRRKPWGWESVFVGCHKHKDSVNHFSYEENMQTWWYPLLRRNKILAAP